MKKKYLKNVVFVVVTIMAFMPTEIKIRLLVPVIAIILYAIYKVVIEIYNYFRLKRLLFNRQLRQSEQENRKKIIDTCNKIHKRLEEEE